MTPKQRQDMENRIDEAMAKFIKDFCAEDSSLIACAESAFYSAKKAVLAEPVIDNYPLWSGIPPAARGEK